MYIVVGAIGHAPIVVLISDRWDHGEPERLDGFAVEGRGKPGFVHDGAGIANTGRDAGAERHRRQEASGF